ncbi:MAG: response regulator [Chlamydiales bacterium]|nr:response regulator [Chlamydiales bacterium]
MPKPAIRAFSSPPACLHLQESASEGSDPKEALHKRSEAERERDRRRSIDGVAPSYVLLHVEDSESIRFTTDAVVKGVNRKEGFPKILYVHFFSGEGAVEYIRKHEVDVVVMDRDLSGGGGKWDGFETAKQIIHLFPHQIIYSASGDGEIDNPTVLKRPIFHGHLGKTGIPDFIRNQLERVVVAERKKELEKFSFIE